jgi:hypothetical protein
MIICSNYDQTQMVCQIKLQVYRSSKTQQYFSKRLSPAAEKSFGNGYLAVSGDT